VLIFSFPALLSLHSVKISIIIVSYNVKYFLEQCLCSLLRAVDRLDCGPGEERSEILVIDNHSADESLSYLRARFPVARFVANAENTGFARACNQGLSMARGDYVLFLNPDTIVAEDSLEKSLAFLMSHSRAGALGVKMLDGKGVFLKESMRGFPTPWVSFCKLSGLAFLFPRSRWFGRYYLGYLSRAENNEVDALSGAFMMVRKEVVDKTGGFDERFFMYAEDIDLSYRIRQAGFCNVYFQETSIIHFKGESTRKDARYVRLFYTAMAQFIRKHYAAGSSRIFLVCLEAGIWLRSRISLLGNFLFERRRSAEPRKIFSRLAGDRTSIKKLSSVFPLPGRVLADRPDEATEVIYCEGPGFTFKKLIEAFEEHKDSLSFKIHAMNSSSFVGSDSKNKSGESVSW